VGLIADIGPGAVALDSAPFIYFIEDDPRYAPLLRPLFEQSDRGERLLVTSVLTLLEVLVVPLRAGNLQIAERYEALLTRSRGLRVVDITRAQLTAAAHLRAATGVKTPDALQLAAALGAGCRTFVTNDRRLPAIPGLRVIQLSKYAK
jgi:predicted nucleic acid-binding protein